jgi:adenine-specific DNA methylase
MTDRKPVFIEKIMPVKLLNEQVYYENGGNPFKGLHRWYSRKPLSFSRASVLGSLLPADISMEEFEYLLGLDQARTDRRETEKEKDDRHQRTRLYKTPPTPERVKRVQELCEQMWGDKTPAVLDAFAGGGSIPFEAARYGLRVFSSDLNPVAVVTMKAAIEFPLKFGAALQVDIDKWVKWVGDEAENQLSDFFPSQDGEKVQNYLWAHTVVCPSCQSVVPLSPNWWLSKTSNYAGKGQARKVTSDWYAVKPIPNLAEKKVDFELIKGKKGKGSSIIYREICKRDACADGDLESKSLEKTSAHASSVQNPSNKNLEIEIEFDPDEYTTISRGVGKCPNCGSVIEDQVVKNQAKNGGLGHQLYAVAFKRGKGNLEFRVVQQQDIDGISLAEKKLKEIETSDKSYLIPDIEIPWSHQVHERNATAELGLGNWKNFFNPRQLLTLVTYVEIINEAKEKIREELGEEKLQAIATYLAMVFDRCVDRNCRLSIWNTARASIERASTQHALNLTWNYPEIVGSRELWDGCADPVSSEYQGLCALLGVTGNNLLASKKIEESKRDACADEDFKFESLDNSSAHASSVQVTKNPSLRITKRKYLPHWQMDGATYFLTFVTQDRLELNDAAREVILKACQFFNGKRYQTFALVIMPDHVHWLLKPLPTNEGAYWTLTSITHSIKSFTAKEIPKVMNHIGKLWQIESYDRIVRDEREFLDTWEYIRQNPVKDGLSESPEDYPFFWEETKNNPSSNLKSPSAHASSVQTSIGEENLSLKEDFFEKSKRDACADGDFQITHASADDLFHLADQSMDAIVTDPPYYSTIQYAELSDFFYVWQKRILGDIFPELYYTELTDKDREAVANPSRFRDMGISPKELADRDYEAKMQSAFGEYYRVLKDNGVMTVQFNHKDSGAWDVLAQSLIVAGFEITASWAVSTENPQNLHQAQKNSVSSTVLLICRKRDPNAGQAWWDDLRPEVANLVEQRAPEFEANEIQGIDLYLSAFGPALNVFSRNYPILDSTGEEVRPEVAFAEARKAVANYRFRKLAQTDTAGFDPLTQWYFLAWDAFQAREFPFDDARQLALAVGGFNVADLGKTYKLLDIKSGTCKLLSPDQRYKKHAFSLVDNEFSARYLIDGLHAIIAIYLEEQTIEPVRRFMKATGLLSNEMFMRAWEVALRVIPHISDPRKRIPEEKALADLWLAMDEIKAKVSYVQPELDLSGGQMGLDFDTTEVEED